MARFTATNPVARIGKQKGMLLKHAMPVEVLQMSGDSKTMQPHNNRTIVFRRWLPVGGVDSATPQGPGGREAGGQSQAYNINRWEVDPNNFGTVEGVTPPERQIQPMDVSVDIKQYGVLFSYTDQAKQFYEDDFRRPIRERCGETVGLIREKIRYAAIRGCINKMYTGGASARSAVDKEFTLGNLTFASQILQGNRARKIKRQIRNSNAGNDISQVEGAYCAFCHTDMQASIRKISGFTPTVNYGHQTRISAHEFGAVNDIRFIMSPELEPYAGAGGAGADTHFRTNSKIDVYPILIMAMEAWAELNVRSARSVGKVIEISADRTAKSDPLSMLGYIGAKFYAAAFVQNDGWMVVLESAAIKPV